MKGYSLDVGTMRKMVDHVRNKLHQENIDVICESYDGQWANLAVKGHKEKPLTRLQLQRHVWSKLGRISKDNLLRIIDPWTKTTNDELDVWRNSLFLTVGELTQGKIHVDFSSRDSKCVHRILSVKCTGGDCPIPSPMTKIHTPLITQRPDIWFDEEDESEDPNILKFTDPNINVLNLLPAEFIQSDTLESAIRGVTDNAIAQQITDDHTEMLPDIPSTDEHRYTGDRIGHSLITVNPQILEQILVGLCSE